MTNFYPTIDLFAGAGGLSQGLAAAGLVPIGASEMDLDALATYCAAHEKYRKGTPLEVFEGDVANHSFRRFRGEIAVVAGGPPCQPYSVGGLRLGAVDERDGLPQFLRVISEVIPDAFVMENVPGLGRGTQVKVLELLLEEFRRLGFYVDWQVLHAANFGVPQRRQRLLIVGSRWPNFRWPEPTHGPSAKKPWKRAGSVLDPSKPIGDENSAIVTYAKQPDLRPSPWDGHLWNGGGRPVNPDGLVPTLLASMGGNKTPWLDGGFVVQDYHTHLSNGGAARSGLVEGARRLTRREAALIQGFKADMPWQGRNSSQYRQIGNAVPVQLAHVIGRALSDHLDNESRQWSVPSRTSVA